MISAKKNNIAVILLYLLFGFGGLWQVLHLFQRTMEVMASPLLVAVAVLVGYDAWTAVPAAQKKRAAGWFAGVLLAGWGVEYIGLRTGVLFGAYQYGDVLQPQILQVPVAIGFSWLTICLSSMAVASGIIRRFRIGESRPAFVFPVLTGLGMMCFDFVMERAAPGLDYWTWQGGTVPLRNYVSWFLTGAFFSWIWVMLRLPLNRFSSLGFHVYLSQLVYFLLVLVKGQSWIPE